MSTFNIATNPGVPFVANFPGGFRIGNTVEIDGVTHAKKGFIINLQDSTGNETIGLHINVRLNDKCMVRNHKENGRWGSEEKHGGMPVARGQHFKIHIAAGPTAFTIRVNDVTFATFNYRLSLDRVNFILIDGEVIIYNIVGSTPHPHHHPHHPIHPIHPC